MAAWKHDLQAKKIKTHWFNHVEMPYFSMVPEYLGNLIFQQPLKKKSNCFHFLDSIVPLIPHVKNDVIHTNYAGGGMHKLID